ncbi:P-loop containing nucleoside triphosphate hydrolase [Phytophthora cactorum]|nr:P-loop containing nucleoside triphosphate hydrolase [Phytophthora cactorum]
MWMSKLLAARLTRPAPCRHIRSPSKAHLKSNLQLVAPHARNFASSSDGFRCQNCGQTFVKWQGQCSACSQWGSVESSKPSEPLFRQSNAASFAKSKPKRAVAWSRRGHDTFEDSSPHALRMNEVELDTFVERIELPERKLGARRRLGSWLINVVAGNPGVGKSTLLEGGNGRDVGDDDYQGFGAVVVDSIQTVYAEDIPSPAGTVNQVKECTLRLLRLAKSRNLPVILIGHVTKSGDIAGPKVLEHIVDTVVQLEGDPQSARRFLRCQKNRFGNTSEVGVFNMTDEGLQPLPNPLMAFVSSHDEDDENPDTGEETEVEPLDGCSVTIAMEGKRPIPLEIQALANRTQYNADAGHGGGQSFSRVRA